ncbi:hypothetical protein WJX73_003364 [Symbiochloris irregularis]|uniref:Cell cycle checkpoint control protein RAD9A n=1 Tax=Symbiochloris irregularis TaxID=706552 RepID=A0AAW1PCT0_9CHLO
MSLKIHIVGSKLRFLKAALVYLAKVGTDELTLEAVVDKFILRSINSSKSAYASFSFEGNFFDAYQLLDTNVIQAGVTMKHALALFRSHRINKMTLDLKREDDQLSVTVLSENGLQKQYKLPLMRTDVLQAAVDDSSFPVCVVAAANELNRLLSSFQTSLDEITIIAMPEREDMQYGTNKAVQIHSYVDPGKETSAKALRTQLELDTQKVFLGYNNQGADPADVTFNLKDFKAMLSLCEALGSNVELRFEAPGNPLVVRPHANAARLGGQDLDLSGLLVLATLRSSQLGLPSALPNGRHARGPGQQAQRTPAGERTPNVPGDTPWLAAGTSGRGAFNVARSGQQQQQQGQGQRDGPAQRPSRFAQERDDAVPIPPQFGDTPMRAVGQDQQPQQQQQQQQQQQPHQTGPPSAATAARRPSARFFDSETEFADAPRTSAGEAPADALPDEAPLQHDHHISELDRHAEGQAAEEQQEQQWWELPQPSAQAHAHAGHDADAAGDDGDEDLAARLAEMPPLRSRYRAMLDDQEEEEEDDEEAVPGTPPG